MTSFDVMSTLIKRCVPTGCACWAANRCITVFLFCCRYHEIVTIFQDAATRAGSVGLDEFPTTESLMKKIKSSQIVSYFQDSLKMFKYHSFLAD